MCRYTQRHNDNNGDIQSEPNFVKKNIRYEYLKESIESHGKYLT